MPRQDSAEGGQNWDSTSKTGRGTRGPLYVTMHQITNHPWMVLFLACEAAALHCLRLYRICREGCSLIIKQQLEKMATILNLGLFVEKVVRLPMEFWRKKRFGEMGFRRNGPTPPEWVAVGPGQESATQSVKTRPLKASLVTRSGKHCRRSICEGGSREESYYGGREKPGILSERLSRGRMRDDACNARV